MCSNQQMYNICSFIQKDHFHGVNQEKIANYGCHEIPTIVDQRFCSTLQLANYAANLKNPIIYAHCIIMNLCFTSPILLFLVTTMSAPFSRHDLNMNQHTLSAIHALSSYIGFSLCRLCP